MVSTLLNIFFGILFLYCFFSVLYLFIFSLAGRLFYKKNNREYELAKRIAVLVPAYKEDNIILSTANSLLQLDYPSHLYDVYIMADSFQQPSLDQLHRLPLNVFEVSFEKSTKTKSLNQAFNRISKSYDIALICDADNILAKDFLKKINDAFLNGAR